MTFAFRNVRELTLDRCIFPLQRSSVFDLFIISRPGTNLTSLTVKGNLCEDIFYQLDRCRIRLKRLSLKSCFLEYYNPCPMACLQDLEFLEIKNYKMRGAQAWPRPDHYAKACKKLKVLIFHNKDQFYIHGLGDLIKNSKETLEV